jgi:hypothetical protein
MAEMIFAPVRYFRRVTAQKRQLRLISSITTKGVGFVILTGAVD